MDILKGLLYINDKDVFVEYGAFLCENKSGERKNYTALLSPAKAKEHTCVSFREEDGERYPDVLTPALEARDVTLSFAIVAASKSDFFKKYDAFLSMLRNGRNGWIVMRLSEIDKTYKLIYRSASDWEQLTDLSGSEVIASFKVKFREPKPAY